MDAIIKVEPATAEITVTTAVITTTQGVVLVSQSIDLAPLVMHKMISLGGCSVTAIPNPNQFAKEGV
jgi:hypothetical protein